MEAMETPINIESVAQAPDVRELVDLIVKVLVDQPEAVRIHEIQGAHSCVLEIEVDAEDVGKVIGRKGIHADALRRLVSAIGGKQKKRYIIEILEER